ncbi:hypothetical protein CRUP_005472 [Coryphaenoides rupestris]|nr:hypothetical protein CRUP_005472 [Coryphaenoides rupestris]
MSPGSEEDDGEGPISEKLGRIQFSIGYSFQDSTLTVKILKGQDLPAKDFSGTSDPFVKLYLLPDKKHKLETKGCSSSLAHEYLSLRFPYEKVRERTLYLQVLDYDRFSRNDPIGEVSIPLNKVELGQIKTFWKELKPCSDGAVSVVALVVGRRGDLLLSLCYNPTANTITVNIIKARNLKAMDIGGTSGQPLEPELLLLMLSSSLWFSFSCSAHVSSLYPMGVCKLNACVSSAPCTATGRTVFRRSALGCGSGSAAIYLSWKSGPAEVKHWKDMMGRPRTNVAQWHALKA